MIYIWVTYICGLFYIYICGSFCFALALWGLNLPPVQQQKQKTKDLSGKSVSKQPSNPTPHPPTPFVQNSPLPQGKRKGSKEEKECRYPLRSFSSKTAHGKEALAEPPVELLRINAKPWVRCRRKRAAWMNVRHRAGIPVHAALLRGFAAAFSSVVCSKTSSAARP